MELASSREAKKSGKVGETNQRMDPWLGKGRRRCKGLYTPVRTMKARKFIVRCSLTGKEGNFVTQNGLSVSHIDKRGDRCREPYARRSSFLGKSLSSGPCFFLC